MTATPKCAKRGNAEEVIKQCPAGACLGPAWMRWDRGSTLGVCTLSEKGKGVPGERQIGLVTGSILSAPPPNWVVPVPSRQDSNQTCRVWSRKNIAVHSGCICLYACGFGRLKVTVITLLRPAHLSQSVSNQSCSVKRTAPVICECVSQRVCVHTLCMHVISSAFLLIDTYIHTKKGSGIDGVTMLLLSTFHQMCWMFTLQHKKLGACLIVSVIILVVWHLPCSDRLFTVCFCVCTDTQREQPMTLFAVILPPNLKHSRYINFLCYSQRSREDNEKTDSLSAWSTLTDPICLLSKAMSCLTVWI